MQSPNMRPPITSFLIAIQAVAIQALRDPVNRALTPRVPPPTDIRLGAVTNSGNGCPSNSITTSLAPSKTLLTYGFDAMSVYIGPGVSPLDKQKNCQLHTSLESRSQPASFAVATVTYKALAFLSPGINLNIYGTWFLSDAASTRSFSYTANNTDRKDDSLLSLREDMTVPPEGRVWTPCGDVGMFTMNLRVKLESANATGSGQIMNDDMFQSGVTVQVGLDWRQCSN